MSENKEETKFIGGNVPIDLYEWVQKSGEKEERNINRQLIVILSRARDAELAAQEPAKTA